MIPLKVLLLVAATLLCSICRLHVAALPGNCASFPCGREPSTPPAQPATQNQDLTPQLSTTFTGLQGDPGVYLPNRYRGPMLTLDYNYGSYRIYCGDQNKKIETAIIDAVFLVKTFLDDFNTHRADDATRLRNWSRLAPISFPWTVEDYYDFRLRLMKFATGDNVRPRIVVCANPNMSKQYGMSSSYHDACTNDPNTVAVVPTAARLTVLCPSFFRIREAAGPPKCPDWNGILQTFAPPYQPQFVEFQASMMLRALFAELFRITKPIVVSPSPNVPNWNGLIRLPRNQKRESASFYQLYVILYTQGCHLEPPGSNKDFLLYMVNLAKDELEGPLGKNYINGIPPPPAA